MNTTLYDKWSLVSKDLEKMGIKKDKKYKVMKYICNIFSVQQSSFVSMKYIETLNMFIKVEKLKAKEKK